MIDSKKNGKPMVCKLIKLVVFVVVMQSTTCSEYGNWLVLLDLVMPEVKLTMY